MPLTIRTSTPPAPLLPHRSSSAPGALTASKLTMTPLPTLSLSDALEKLSPACKEHLLALARHLDLWQRARPVHLRTPLFYRHILGITAVLLSRIQRPDALRWFKHQVPLVVAAAARLAVTGTVDLLASPRSWNEVCEAARLQEELGHKGPMGRSIAETGPSNAQIRAQASRRQLFYSALSHRQPPYLLRQHRAEIGAPANLAESRVMHACEAKIGTRARTLRPRFATRAEALDQARAEYLSGLRESLALHVENVTSDTMSHYFGPGAEAITSLLPAPQINPVVLRLLQSISWDISGDETAAALGISAISKWLAQGGHRPNQDVDMFAAYLVKHLALYETDARTQPVPTPPSPAGSLPALSHGNRSVTPSPPTPHSATTPIMTYTFGPESAQRPAMPTLATPPKPPWDPALALPF